MKKLLYFILVVLTISSCTTQSSNGQLVGATGRPIWYQADPYGMLYIQSGAFNMGQSDEDVPNTIIIRQKLFLLRHFIWTKQKLQIMNIVSL